MANDPKSIKEISPAPSLEALPRPELWTDQYHFDKRDPFTRLFCIASDLMDKRDYWKARALKAEGEI